MSILSHRVIWSQQLIKTKTNKETNSPFSELYSRDWMLNKAFKERYTMENKSFFLGGLSKFLSSKSDYWLTYPSVPDNTNNKWHCFICSWKYGASKHLFFVLNSSLCSIIGKGEKIIYTETDIRLQTGIISNYTVSKSVSSVRYKNMPYL